MSLDLHGSGDGHHSSSIGFMHVTSDKSMQWHAEWAMAPGIQSLKRGFDVRK